MSEKRKDNKERVLKTGESQRKDLIYQYRYTNVHGKRQTIYSSDLKELREKEKVIQKQLDDGIDYAAGEVAVITLLERYISLKQGVRYNTKVGYNFVLNLIKKEDFGYRQIRDIKVSDAQQWIMKLHNDGKGYSTITSVRGVVKPAFQMAYNEDIIRRNPFDFKLVGVVPNDSLKRIAMTEEVYHSLKNILANRPKLKTEAIIDGYSGFLLIDKDNHPKVALHIENEMRWAMKKYTKLYPEKPLPHITPHVFRHTFCTNMANAGMDIKTLQYVMGHSDVGVTLNVYTHASYDRAAEQMTKILDFKADTQGKPRKSG